MVSGRRRVYWDSCVWLSYINGCPGRLPVLETLLADSRTRLADIELITSTIAQTEVAFALAEWESHTLDPEVEAKIDSLWTDRRAITLVEYHTAVAKEARDLIRIGIEHQWQLKPLDAIHLATASVYSLLGWHKCSDSWYPPLEAGTGTVGAQAPRRRTRWPVAGPNRLWHVLRARRDRCGLGVESVASDGWMEVRFLESRLDGLVDEARSGRTPHCHRC